MGYFVHESVVSERFLKNNNKRLMEQFMQEHSEIMSTNFSGEESVTQRFYSHIDFIAEK